MSEATKPYLVFYASKLLGHFPRDKGRPWAMPRDMPDGAYIYDQDRKTGKWALDGEGQWYRSDFTPVLDSDVPAELKAWLLIL